MDSKRKIAVGIATTAVGFLAMGGTASANHDHYLGLPNGKSVQVAEGSTSQTSGGACHKFHEHVHLGITESSTLPNNIGDGHSPVTLTTPGGGVPCP